MGTIKVYAKRLTESRLFEWIITIIIIVNSILIGVETYTSNPLVAHIQHIILGIFTFEIVARFIASDSIKDFFKSGWNLFDLTLVVIGYIPDALIANASMFMAFRVLRVFRVLRLLRAAREIKIMISVLVKSMSTLFYNVILFVIFVYLFALVGVAMFKLPDPNTLSEQDRANYELLMATSPHAPVCSPDPYGSVDEAMFTLFRALTGNWTDLRYDLIKASEYGVVKVSTTAVTTFHVLWFILSAYLLLNLLVAAIVNNYQSAMDANNAKDEEPEE